jgi:hypothetical protein
MVQIPRKFIIMDIVIVDVPPTYGMLLSRHKGTSIRDNIWFEISYATILIYGGETCPLYKEPKMIYVTSNLENPTNFPS